MRRAYILLSALIIASCTHGGGTMITDAQIDAFQDGHTTAADVVRALGPPTTDVRDSTGLHILGYSAVRSQVSGATFVPIVGMFAGGASGQTRTVMFTFDKTDTLTKHTVLSSQFGS